MASIDPTLRLSALLRQRRVVVLMLAHGLIYIPHMGFITYNTIVVVSAINGAPVHAGILVALFSFVFPGIATRAGRIVGHFVNQFTPLVLATLSPGGGLFLFSTAPNVPVMTVGVVALGVGIGVMGPLFRSMLGNIAPR